MRKLFPLILIVVAGCGSSARSMFRPATKTSCAEAPCDSLYGGSESTGEVILDSYPVTEAAIPSE